MSDRVCSYTVKYPCRHPLFSCKNIRCIMMDQVLDGKDDCGDQSDEGRFIIAISLTFISLQYNRQLS